MSDGRTLPLVRDSDPEETEATHVHAPDQTVTVGTVADAAALDLPPTHHGNGTARNCRTLTGATVPRLPNNSQAERACLGPGRPSDITQRH
ncbi:hypothetical protein SSPO_095920 [Streptomyces antimycoticus]|uniref:Uncharacterized protein n=1 Tax=Streptomyces antimycoticus TaxID=68175 RepID=A0A499UY05_9ACTN|nr:hypothetical protein SSPO_095920 [Streptomyces antimycoticus]